MTVAFPKPTRAPRARQQRSRKRPPIPAQEYLAWLRQQPSCLSGDRPCEAAHVLAVVSLKTHHVLPRRKDAAILAAVPLTSREHKEASASIHQLGEAGFERHHGLPEGHLQRLALTYLATYLLENP